MRCPRPLASFLAAVLGVASLGVTAGPALAADVDAEPPAITSVGVSPSSVDTSASSQTMTITVHVTDDVTGITGMMSSGSVYFRSPSGRTQLSGYFNESRRTDGTPQDGTYTVTTTLPRYSETGTWTLAGVSASDGAGRYTSLYGDQQLANAGLAASFTQDGADDHTAPTITSVDVMQAQVDTSAAAATLTVIVKAADDASGLNSGSVYFRSPSGRQQVYAWFNEQNRGSGDAQDGKYNVTATLPRYSEQGTWTLSSVNVSDLAGNSVYLSGSQLAGANVAASFEQTGIDDHIAPSVTGVSVSPAAVNPAVSTQTITAEVQISDDLSGITGPAYGSLNFQGPNWQSAYGSIQESRRISGDARNGTYSVDVTVPKSSALGTWKLSSINVSDGAGNSLNLWGDQLAANGIAAAFDVVDTVSVPSAPTAVSATKGNAQATVSWAAPARDGGAAVTSYEVVASAGDTVVKTVTVPAPAPASSSMPGPGYPNISATVTGLANGTAHTFTVTATNNAGTGPASAPSLPVTPYDPASDKTAPSLTSLSLSPTSIDTSDAARTIKATVRITDNLAGFSSGSVNFRSPSGRQSLYASFSSWNRTSGTDLDGTYETTMTVNRYAEAGTWKVDSVSLMDQASNSRWMGAADFAATGLPNSFEQTGSVSDLSAPRITEVTVSPASVDTSPSSQTIKVSAHLTDDLAGVSSASLTFRSPSGRQSAYGSLWSRTAGTILDGTWEGTVTVSRYAEKGTWTLDSVNLTDTLSNNRSMNRTELSAAGVSATFEQTGASDTTAPTLAELSFSPTSVDTSQSSQTVKVTLRVKDDLAGLSSWSSPSVYLRSPTGRQSVYGGMASRVSGTDLDSVWETTITLPVGSEKGTWSVSGLSLTDVLGNNRTITTADLESANLPTGFTQTGAADTTAPVLTGLTFSTQSIDTSAAAASISIRAQFSDSGSGMSSYGPYISFTSPSNRQYASAMLQRTSGTAQDGTYEGTVTIPRYAERGTWTLSGVSASDQIGNYATVNRDTLAAANLPSSFEQTGTDDSTAPRITAITVSPQSVDTSGAAASATVRISVSDDLSGLTMAPWVQFASPTGRMTASYVSFMRVSGDDHSATYEGTLTLPRYAEQGTWKVTSAGVTDASNNRLELDAAGLQAAGLSATLAQTGAHDSTPPALGAFSIETASVDTSSASQPVRLTTRITDDLIGVAPYATVTFRSASGRQTANGYFWNRTGGTDLNASYEGGVYLPRYAESGTWTLDKLTLRDLGGNTVELSGADVAAAGFPTTFTQTGSPSDTSAPEVTALTVSPAAVDASTSARTVKVQVHATDDLSGIGYNSRITITSPSGTTKLEGYLNPVVWPANGAILDGTMEATVTVPRGAEAGVWRVTRLELADGANNVITFDADGLAAAGLAAGLEQTNGLPGAPAGLTATAGDGSATVTWTAPAANGTAAVTGYRVTTYAGGTAVKTDTVDAAAGTATVEGLTNGTAYTFTVAAINPAGTGAESAASAAVTPVAPITVPGAPTGVVATAGNASATVAWTAPAATGGSPVTSYTVTVYSAGVAVRTLPVTAPATTVTVTGLTNKTAYTFTVAATNAAGTGPESAASGAVAPKPGNTSKPKGK